MEYSKKIMRRLNRAARRNVERHPTSGAKHGVCEFEEGRLAWVVFGFDRLAYKKVRVMDADGSVRIHGTELCEKDRIFSLVN